MNRLLFAGLFLTFLLLPPIALAENRLAALEEAVQNAGDLQPGLKSYQTTVQTDRIASTIESMTTGMPAEMPRPAVPVVTKYWRRGAAASLIVAEGEQASPFMQQMVQRVSASLAIEPEMLILPPGKDPERQRLADQATVRSTETILADNVLRRIEIVFALPTDLGDAFYGSGLRLPQKDVTKLQFDIDIKSRTVRELTVQTANGEQLLAEFRYRPVTGGLVPERVRTTSPDGKVDDVLEVTFTETAGFLLPARTVRTLNRPNLKDTLDVTFSAYRINQPFPAEVDASFDNLQRPGTKAP